MSELCDIQAISICDVKYHSQMKDKYREHSEIQVPKNEPGTIDYSKDQQAARDAMFAIFGSAKKGLVM